MRALPDVQSTKTGFPNLPIQKVGVRHIRAPFNFVSGEREQIVLADFSAYCDLADSLKGINMSRMAETISTCALENIAYPDLVLFALKLKEAHKTDSVYIKAVFDYVFTSLTPVTGRKTIETIPVILECSIKGEVITNLIQITYTGISLCPCSKEMSLLINNLTMEEEMELDFLSTSSKENVKSLVEKIKLAGFGAHNQKSHIELKIVYDSSALKDTLDPDPIGMLKHTAMTASSAGVRSMLKREDEKYITEASYMGMVVTESHRNRCLKNHPYHHGIYHC